MYIGMQEVINVENDFLDQWSVVVVLCGSLPATDIVKKAVCVANSFEGLELYQEENTLDDTAQKLVITCVEENLLVVTEC